MGRHVLRDHVLLRVVVSKRQGPCVDHLARVPGDRRVPRIRRRWRRLRRHSSARKQAEQNLTVLSALPSLLSTLLQLVVTSNQDRSVRLAASVYLKNTDSDKKR